MKLLKLGIITSTLLCGTLAFASTPEFSAKGKSTQKIRFNGRIQTQFESLKTDNETSTDPNTVNEFLVRRAYFGVKGTIQNGVAGELVTNFGSGTGELDKAIITVVPMDETKLSFGFDKIPVGYEETTSSSKIATVERSIVTRYFTEQYDLGARMTGIHFSGDFSGLYYKASITNPTQGETEKNVLGTENEMALSGRIGFKGAAEGFDYNVGVYGAHFGDTTKAATDSALVYGAFADLKFGFFSVLGEAITGDFNNTAAADTSPFGFQIMPRFKLNDAFDIVLRYADMDGDGTKIDISDTFRRANDGAAKTYDEARSYYIGGNWYIDGDNLKLTFGYEFADYEANGGEDADVDGLRARLQILF